MEIIDRRRFLRIAHDSLTAVSYQSDLIQEDWQFADIFERGEPSRSVPLVAFGQEPPSYRTACWAVTFGADHEDILQLRALGAPQVLQIQPQSIVRWKMNAAGQPEAQDHYDPDQLQRVFLEHRDTWDPSTVLRLKGSAFDLQPYQMDLYDAGLIPAIDTVVFSKLDQVLRNAIAKGRMVFSEHHYEQLDERQLVRLVFRLLAAKVFGDRGYQGVLLGGDPKQALAVSRTIYGNGGSLDPTLADPATQEIVWHEIRSAFNLQNISVEALAHVYENTLVTSGHRRSSGTHATPPTIAEYIVRRLPFESVEENQRRVFEPFAGHAVFLTAAMGRMRELLDPGLTKEQKHHYFQQALAGMEIDPFAAEVARLCLLLADYPNPNGWNIEVADVLTSPHTRELLGNSSIVLCNPPFGWTSAAKSASIDSLGTVNPAADILRKVLDTPPALLGFVLPWSFVDGQSFRDIRQKVAETYGHIEVVSLPDRVFAHSEAEPVLLLVSDKDRSPARFRCAEVRKQNYASFIRTWEPSWETSSLVTPAEAKRALWVHPLDSVWEELGHLQTLGDVAAIHRGVEYRVPLREHLGELVRSSPAPGFAAGLVNVNEGFEPYIVGDHVYLNMDPDLMRRKAYLRPWTQPKVILNAARISRGPWRLSAAPDRSGLVCYQRFQGVWPTTDISIEVLSAVLNGFIANAYISTAKGSRDVTISRLKRVPVPNLSIATATTIMELVGDYRSLLLETPSGEWNSRSLEDCKTLLNAIDETVLESYDLGSDLKRQILREFSNHPSRLPPARRQPHGGIGRLVIGPAQVARVPNEPAGTRAGVASAISELSAVNSILGPSIVRVIADVEEQELEAWLDGKVLPPADTTGRLAHALEIANLLLEVEDAETVQAWFAGKNQMLGDRAPALMLRVNPVAVRRAARAFSAYG